MHHPRTTKEREALGLSTSPKPNTSHAKPKHTSWIAIGTIGLLASLLISLSFI